MSGARCKKAHTRPSGTKRLGALRSPFRTPLGRTRRHLPRLQCPRAGAVAGVAKGLGPQDWWQLPTPSAAGLSLRRSEHLAMGSCGTLEGAVEEAKLGPGGTFCCSRALGGVKIGGLVAGCLGPWSAECPKRSLETRALVLVAPRETRALWSHSRSCRPLSLCSRGKRASVRSWNGRTDPLNCCSGQRLALLLPNVT